MNISINQSIHLDTFIEDHGMALYDLTNISLTSNIIAYSYYLFHNSRYEANHCYNDIYSVCMYFFRTHTNILNMDKSIITNICLELSNVLDNAVPYFINALYDVNFFYNDIRTLKITNIINKVVYLNIRI